LKTPVFNTSELSNWALLKRLLALSWRYRAGCLKLLCAQLILLLSGLGSIGLTGLGIDELRHAIDPTTRAPQWPHLLTPPTNWPPLHILFAIAGAVLLLAVVRMAMGYLNGVWFGELLQGRTVVDLRAECYDKLQRLNFRFFDANSSSSLINRIGGDVQSVRLFMDGVLFQLVNLAVSVTAFLGYMLAVDVKLTLACLATTPLLWAASALFSRAARPAYKHTSDLFDALVQRLAESIRGMQVIKAFGREQHELAKLERANDEVRDAQHQIFRKVSTFVPFTLFLSQANIIILLGYGGWLAVHEEIGVGTGLVSFAAILQQFSGQIANIGNIANSMQQCLRSAQRVFEILDAPIAIQAPESPRSIAQLRGEVAFENVSFSHGETSVLGDISMQIPAGSCVALIGPTGSGKSSLLNLIPRFYDPSSGRVRIDGHDIAEFDPLELRKHVGLVFQESFLFSSTIGANIAFGKPDATQTQIEKAAKIAAAHDFITALPDGYNTVLGEAGVGLSGGQKQRLAIARALLLDPAILLLDDPTAAVDPGTEHEIVEAMQAAMAGRTTFVIAHRPAMLRRASQIFVIENGRITQTGTHDALMQTPGYYRNTLSMQSGISISEEPEERRA
jgi:ATP-binding cassette subfamily B protein